MAVAITRRELQALVDGYSKGNDLERWFLNSSAATTEPISITSAVTASAQMYCLGGHVAVDRACEVTFHTESTVSSGSMTVDTTTQVGKLVFAAAGTEPAPVVASNLGHVLCIKVDTADTDFAAVFHTKAVMSGQHVSVMP